ncbi:MAG: rpsI [Rickettsiaceae bacterium]|jgi:small subunit ribosomal protein S9|nr:rpsI [Rickettsiaceae bacterium]
MVESKAKKTLKPTTRDSVVVERKSDKSAQKAGKAKADQALFTGRRKNAVARVAIRPGTGNMVINHVSLEKYFPRESHRQNLLRPFAVTKTLGQYDVFCTVKGGGHTGQAGAILLGIARALDKADAEFRPTLRQNGLLTRDARVVERKKYGKRKARRSTQFSKR